MVGYIFVRMEKLLKYVKIVIKNILRSEHMQDLMQELQQLRSELNRALALLKE